MSLLTNTSPNITVLMSCYNATRWLNEAITSVLNQTYTDFEFIIVDDGSSDNTLEIIQQFSAIDSRIVVITKPNSGLADSLNMGIQKARGEWIARLDADDLCTPDRLEKQYAIALAKPKLVFIGSGLTIIDKDGIPQKTYRYPYKHNTLLNHLTTHRAFPAHSSAFYRTSAVLSIGGYRIRIRRSQDSDLWLRLFEIGQFACIKEPLVFIRKHSAQISHDDGGNRQIIDANLALTSYFLRRNGYLDPIAGDQNYFETYLAWITKQLEDHEVFDFSQNREHLKRLFKKSHYSFSAFADFIKVALTHPILTLRLFIYPIRGNTLPQQLALAWIKAQQNNF